MEKIFKTMDGNEAASHIAYGLTDIAAIYPITPSSPMAEHTDEWSVAGRKNIFGQEVELIEMQAESGAIAAVHGAVETGALATTFTSSQGLLLMIPTMYRIAGQAMPAVMHVAGRTVGTNNLSIYGDQSDVYACRQTGFAQLGSSNVQECMDLGAIAHLSAIKGSLPFMHFFDGFRTSHEIQKIEVLDYDILDELVDHEAITRFRNRALNPNNSFSRSEVAKPEVFFQQREAINPLYNNLSDIVEDYMDKLGDKTGRYYKPFMYYGPEDAEHVVIAMGSVAGAIEEVVDYLSAKGEKVGFLKVVLYRPFDQEKLLKTLPETAKYITVLDRTKEAGAGGEPLYLDVSAALKEREGIEKIVGGRYGISSKDTTTGQMLAVFENSLSKTFKNGFTVGIKDDLTHLSLDFDDSLDLVSDDVVSCKFWGFGSDGTVGANKNSIKIIGDNTNKNVQAYFEYDAKKSGGVTRSHLRFGDSPIRGSYLVKNGDFIACHNQSYIEKYDIVQEVKPGGTFLLNCMWSEEELDEKLPSAVKKYIYANNINFYIINAIDIAKQIGLGNRTNTILQSAFFYLANIIDFDLAKEKMKEANEKSYGRKGQNIVDMNNKAVDLGYQNLVKVSIPDSWENPEDDPVRVIGNTDYMRQIGDAVLKLKGDDLPVSAFADYLDGTMPSGTSKFEKRGVATQVPVWIKENCIQCNQCAFVCPHAAIRSFLLTEEEAENAPEGYKYKDAIGKGMDEYKFAITVDTLDCYGCGVCVNQCPAKEKALVFERFDYQEADPTDWEYSINLSHKDNPLDKFSLKGSQFEQPLIEFSGACAGCGETAYMKIMTQLFGDKMIIANATGCSQAWGFTTPGIPYTRNWQNKGPALSNSLFENNAEFSLGMTLSVKQQRKRLRKKVEELVSLVDQGSDLHALSNEWLNNYDSKELNGEISDRLVAELEANKLDGRAEVLRRELVDEKNNLSYKSMWMYGGDGWAYDIGYGGLDHVLNTGEDVNILVVDTEVYSNTGGQASKATQIGAVAKFAAGGKQQRKKDLALLAMNYENVYVAKVSLGANPNHLVKALKEAEAHDGPSILVAYAPCITHGMKGGMANSLITAKDAVDVGYWHLFRYNPALKAEGKNPFILDSKEPNYNLIDYMQGQTRFASLLKTNPEIADKLAKGAVEAAKDKYAQYKKLAED
ncbi:MAG: pyruvate:ferredoxin (flavodoxin) oxidoreductase [Anaerococcus sp.]|nr:pyruvate:ferredoxin (flavodoxin) oxidoreductase [Anaerococcus sp.]